jgi:hypothetical protein
LEAKRMPSFQDPITDVEYDPIGDPTGTAKQAAMIVAGIGMTLVLFGISQQTVVPLLADVFDAIPGIDSGQGGQGKIVFGGE